MFFAKIIMIDNNPFKPQHFSLNCNGKLLILNKPKVMGVLNVTPDSFFDGGKFVEPKDALQRAERMVNEGVDIIDIGGSSSRPGSKPVECDIELKRVIPVIKAIHKAFPETILSIDTFRARVAEEAVQAGASIVNDISAGEDDKDMVSTVAKLKVPYIAMHKQGQTVDMQKNPSYDKVSLDVLDYFIKKVGQLREAGIVDMVIDPGFGFGKTTEHNYSILKHLSVFKILDCPILVGVSRKRMINEVLNVKAEDSLNGTTAVNTIALLNGANILRVHDVKEAVELVKIYSMYNSVAI